MNEFEAAPHDKVAETGRTLGEAHQAGHDYEVHLHSGRIRDLLDLTARHGIDTSDRIDATRLESLWNGL